MTARVRDQVKVLCQGKSPDERVLEYASVNIAWTGLRRIAGVRESTLKRYLGFSNTVNSTLVKNSSTTGT